MTASQSSLPAGGPASPAGRYHPWMDQAACRDYDPELWFPIGTTGPALQQTTAAIGVCEGCPVREQCLDFALEVGADDGIYGGVTPDGRRKLRRNAYGKAARRRRRMAGA